MVFPVNYKLGEKEDNLSVKFKLLINKREMFEAELPCLGKKNSCYTAHLSIVHQPTLTRPQVNNWSNAQCGHRPTHGTHTVPDPEAGWPAWEPYPHPCWPGHCLPSAPLSDIGS